MAIPHYIDRQLGENIFHIELRRFATPPITGYIFSQLAVNMWYCPLKFAISLQSIKRDFLKHKTVKTNDKIRHFGVVMTPLPRKILIRSCNLQHLKRFWREELT